MCQRLCCWAVWQSAQHLLSLSLVWEGSVKLEPRLWGIDRSWSTANFDLIWSKDWILKPNFLAFKFSNLKLNLYNIHCYQIYFVKKRKLRWTWVKVFFITKYKNYHIEYFFIQIKILSCNVSISHFFKALNFWGWKVFLKTATWWDSLPSWPQYFSAVYAFGWADYWLFSQAHLALLIPSTSEAMVWCSWLGTSCSSSENCPRGAWYSAMVRVGQGSEG